MQNVILAHDGSVVAPRRYSTTQQQTAQQPSSSTHSTRNQKHHHQQLQQQSDADDNCAYLQRHCIPSKVEGLFSNVLNDLPNDPLLHIVEQLRASNNSNNLSNGGNPPNHSKQATNESIREGATGSGTTEGKEPVPPTTPCAPFTRTALVSEGLNPEPPTRGNNPVSGAEDPFVHSMNVATESGCRPVGENLNTPPASVDAAGLSLANATPTTTPLTTSATPSVTTCESMNAFTLASGRARTPTPPAFSELSCTNYRGSVNGARPATHAMRPSSRGSSRNEVVQGVCGVRFGATNDIFYGGPMPPTLDRDESTRSDLSAFSVASMDLQDFLQEFRSAKVESVGAEAKMVDINAISDIIQNVNIPLPDTPIIADLFDEVRNIAALRYDTEASPDQANDMDCQKRISATTTVVTGSESNLIDCIYFEAFLARMAFMIQGRYPMEVLRGTFYSIGESARQKPSADGAAQPSSVTPPQTTQQQQQQKVCAEDIRGPSTSSFGVASRPYRVAAKSGCRNSNSGALSADSSSNTHTSPTVIPTTAACPINCSAAEQAAEPSALLNGVPLAICVEEGLWRGLGLPATREEVERALHTLGIPVDGNYKCHVNDFVRLVTVLTSGGMSGLSCEKTSPWGPVGIGRESSFLQQPQE
ncbi:uncharacterized protein TEOVI_000407300 [Trypanosoma equiperdum]|uniref:Uncharacterized protein n=1 Tax=Trypanosoma equiperdum TaxID=5694 RepID=A0A1G4IJJ4_TRYEQ|nr:hypothetical protein, conserved [Trypanosoma equiperdum]